MDLDYTNIGLKFYGTIKGRTYERPDAHRDGHYRRPVPRLVKQHLRVIALPEELETTSQRERGVREEIRDRVGAALARVEISLHTISYASSMDAGLFDDYSDDELKIMSRSELEQYETYCRDNYKRIVA